MAKNIAIFSDGTRNDTDKGYSTNVFKLYKMVERRSQRQQAFYDPGVGTDFLDVAGAAFGVGISKNIRECYEFLVDTYERGDCVYLFGFSRGAFTVRSLGGMVSKSGLLKKQHRGKIEDAFKVYRRKNNEDEARQFQRDYCHTPEDNQGRPIAIQFIGAWDTVGALGFPLSAVRSLNPFSARWHGFHNTRLSEDVKYGYQALAVDEKRKVFKPELWDESRVDRTTQTVEQVWFAGVHSNIGGGYRRSELSDITLRWMAKKAEAAGLHLWEDYDRRVLMQPDPHGKIYDPRAGWGGVYVPAKREIPGGALVHQSVLTRVGDRSNGYGPDNLPNDFTVYDDDGPMSVETRAPLPSLELPAVETG